MTTTDPHVVAAIHIGRGFHTGAALQAMASSRRCSPQEAVGLRNASQRFLRAAREAATDMGTREVWAWADIAASGGYATATKKIATEVVETMTNNRKEQGK